MNVQTLASTLQFITELDRSLGVQPNLQAVLSSLESIVQQPAHPPNQQNLANALAAFEESVIKMTERISPGVRSLIKEIGGEMFFDPTIARDVKQAIVANAMTPSVARDFVRKLATDRDSYLSVVNSTNQGVRRFGIEGEQLPTGTAEFAVMIPREIFKNDLGTFAKELGFLNRLLSHVGELITAEPTRVSLGQLSSSDPTLTFDTALSAMKFVGSAVSKFLDAWKKVAEIREILQRLKNVGMGSKTTVTELTEEITSTVESVVEESTTEILSYARLGDSGRRNELDGLIRKDLRRLFGQVEQGLVIEIRVSPAATDQEPDPNLDTLKILSQTLQFPQTRAEPILLSDGELIDDEDDAIIAGRQHRRTTTTKTTTRRKSSKTESEHRTE